MKKVLFLFPNAANWPTICSSTPILAGIAKKSGWEIDYFDTYNYEKSIDSSSEKEKAGGFKPGFCKQENINQKFSDIVLDLQKKLNETKPDLLAISVLSHEYEFLMSFFNEIKIPVMTKVIIGGIHPTLKSEEVAKSGQFDIICAGEGEKTFHEVLQRIDDDVNIKNIAGTLFFDRLKKIIKINPKRNLLSAEELWAIESDFSFFEEKYFIRPFDGKTINRYDVDIGRGCPYNCAYCGNSALKNYNEGLGKYVKSRPLKSTYAHLKNMRDNYKVDIFQFMDECFLAHSISWLKDFMDMYKQIGLPFIFQTRAETISEEKIKLLKSYKIPFQASVGVESGSEKIMHDVCDRKCTVKQVIDAFEILNRENVRSNAFFMLGLPFEKRENIFKTIELCRKIKPSVASVAIFQPLPGQKLTETCIREGFITGNESMATFTSHSLLKMPKPYLSSTEIRNLWRVFILYSVLPKTYYSQIEKCEKNYEANQELFDELMKLRWEKYDFAITKGDIKLV